MAANMGRVLRFERSRDGGRNSNRKQFVSLTYLDLGSGFALIERDNVVWFGICNYQRHHASITLSYSID